MPPLFLITVDLTIPELVKIVVDYTYSPVFNLFIQLSENVYEECFLNFLIGKKQLSKKDKIF